MAAPKGNKYAVGLGGRNKKFATPNDMQKVIDEYFYNCDNRIRQVYIKSHQDLVDVKCPVPYTIEGLCNALGLCRDALLNYEKEPGYEDFHDTVKAAKLKVQQNLVERGLEGENNSAVSIFVMKNNFGYKDKTEHEMTGKDGEPLFNEKPLSKNELKKRLEEIENEI